VSLPKPRAPDRHFALGMFENDRRVCGADFSAEQAIDTAVVTLMVGPIRQLASIGIMTQHPSTLSGQEA
jgi:hypothetical protein